MLHLWVTISNGMKDKYKHTQIGYLVIFLLFILTIYFWFISRQSDADLLTNIIMLFVLFLISSFSSLGIIVDEKYLRIKFGYGIFKRKFILKEIDSIKIVKNRWYHGWGIRVWFKPFMRIYNVSGFDAIEIIMKDKKIYRIGTDEPEKLKVIIFSLIEK